MRQNVRVFHKTNELSPFVRLLRHSTLLPLAVCLLLSCRALPQTSALQTTQDFFTINGGLCVVKVYGLHVTNNVLGRTSEIRIQDGAVLRGASRWVHGERDVAIPVGQSVQIQRIEAAQDPKSDLLRVYVSALGSVLPVSFVVPKGSLQSMGQPQMQALIETVFQPQTAAPQQTQSAPAPQTPASAPVRAAAPPQTAPPAAPQRTPLPSENVVDLDGILKQHNGDAIWKIEGVHAVMASPDYTKDNVIASGVFQPRRTGGIYRGMRDMVLWPKSHVTFLQLSALTDDENDILHLVVRSDMGALLPSRFCFRKGN